MKTREITMTVVNLSELAVKIPEIKEIAELYAMPDDLGEYPHQYWSQSLHLAPLEDIASYLTPEQEEALWHGLEGEPENLYVLLTD